MKNVILIVEDKKEEQLIAKDAVLTTGNKVIIADTLDKAESFIEKFSGNLSGVITDIHFPLANGRGADEANGVSVVLTALIHNIPCAVCTDDVAHGGQYIALIVERLEKLVSRSIPVSSSKDWTEALQQLTKIMEVK
jgi:CheY-like chemotaxis protein